MRTTSRILGIIGSVLAILLGGFAISDALTPSYFDYDFEYYDEDYGDYDTIVMPLADDMLPNENDTVPEEETFWDDVDVTDFVFGCLSVLGGVLGVIGCIVVNKKNTLAGGLFIVASVISISAFYPTILFIIAAVNALRKPKLPVPMMFVPIPAGAYPGYYPLAFPPADPSAPYPYPPCGAAYPPPPSVPMPGAVSAPIPPPSGPFPPYGAYSPPGPFQPGPAFYPYPPYVNSWAAPPPQGPASPPSEENKANETSKEVE